MTPLKHIALADAIQMCAASWSCSIPEAYERLRRSLHAGQVQSAILKSNGQIEKVQADWANRDNNRAYSNGMIAVSYPPLSSIDYPAFVREEDLEKLLAENLIGLPTNDEGSADRKVLIESKDKGGAPEVYDWEAMWIEIVRIGRDDGMPATPTELRKRMQDWFAVTYGQHPSDNAIRPKIQRLFARLHETDDGS